GICDGLMATTLPVRGLFAGSWRDLGVAGGFSHGEARRAFAEADLVIAVGASLTHHTVDGGRLFPNARLIQIDPGPSGIRHGRHVHGLFVRADGRLGVEALIAELGAGTAAQPTWDARALAA